MANSSNQYDGPELNVEVNAVANEAYEWKIELSAADYRGTTKLGYKASGLLANLTAPPGKSEILVHDKDRAVWTPMPTSHRADVRYSMETLLSSAIAALKAGKHS